MNVIDLFSGIGGFSIGFERAGMQTAAFCEIDPRARKVLAHHWPEVPIYEDVRTIDHAEGDADVICGGFPCQDISLAGEGAGLAGERSGLWRELLRAIRVVRPSFAVVENVAALLGRGMDVVLGDLAEIGYDAEWHCIRASDLGAPHGRDRVWIIAYPIGSRGTRLVTSADLGAPGPWRLRVARRICSISPTLRSSAEIVGLNPSFAEWMMGYPEDWTACIASGMPSSRKSRKRLGEQS